MTAQASAVKPQTQSSRFLRYVMYRIGKMKYFIILMFLFSLLAYPVYMIFYGNYLEAYRMWGLEDMDKKWYDLKNIYTGISGASVVLGVAGIGIMTPLSVLLNFRHLFLKRYVNMDMSLPISFSERFSGDMIISFFTTFLPHIISILLGYAVIADMRANGLSEQIDYTTERWEQIMHMAPILALMLFFSTLFVLSLCGRLIPAAAHWIILNITVPLSIAIWYEIAVTNGYGMVDNSMAGSDFTLMAATSPLGLLFGYMSRDVWSSPLVVTLCIVFVVLLAAASYFLQKYRRTERTGESYAFKYARHFLVGLELAAVAIYFMFPLFDLVHSHYMGIYSNSIDAVWCVILWIIASAVIIFLGEVSDTLRFRHFPRTLACSAIAIAAGVGAGFIARYSDGLGKSGYIPAESDILYVNADVSIGYDHLHINDMPYEQAAALHRRILNERPDQSGYPYNTLYISYMMNDVTVVERHYQIPLSIANDAYDTLFGLGAFASDYGADYGYFYGGRPVSRFEGYKLIRAYMLTDAFPWKNSSEREIDIEVPLDKFEAAMQQDAKDTTFEQLYYSPYGLYYPVELEYGYGESYTSHYVNIYPFFKRTMALFDEYGFDIAQYSPEITDAFLVRTNNPYQEIEDYNSVLFDEHIGENGELVPYDREYRHVKVDSPEYEQLSQMSANVSKYSDREPRYYMIYIRRIYDEQNERYSMMLQPIPECETANAAALWDTLDPAVKDDVDYYRYEKYRDDIYWEE